MAEEGYVPFPAPREQLGMAAFARGTLIASSLRSLRARNLVDAYYRALRAVHHPAIHALVATSWVPMDVSLAHYDALATLITGTTEQVQIGREVALRIQGTYLGTLARMAGSAGVTPWLAFAQYQRMYERMFSGGGGVAVYKLGPKECRVELVGLPLARIGYFRAGFRGVNEAGCELFCRKAYAQEISKLCTPTTIVFRVAWA